MLGATQETVVASGYGMGKMTLSSLLVAVTAVEPRLGWPMLTTILATSPWWTSSIFGWSLCHKERFCKDEYARRRDERSEGVAGLGPAVGARGPCPVVTGPTRRLHNFAVL